jgi:hypothetical protein
VVEEVRGADGAVKITCKKDMWLTADHVASKLRATKEDLRASAAGGGYQADEPEAMEDWELVQKGGFLAGPAEDQVGSEAEARAKVMADPETYMGYTCPVGAQGAYVRKWGSSFVQIGSFTSYFLSCRTLKYEGKLFEDAYVTNTSRFPGGLENGKDGAPSACWKRPGRGEGLLDKPINLCGAIEPNDLKQGKVGDCSLIAAIACLCEFPDAVLKLFDKRRLSQTGCYEISLWDWGRKDWVKRQIDDRFATSSKDSPDPLFAQASEDGEIFPMLLEKAVAVMAGGFDYMSSIMPPWALGVLTGCPDVWIFNVDRGQWTGYRPVYDGTSTYENKQSVYEGCWPDGSSGRSPKGNADMWECMRQWDEKHYMTICGSAAQGKSDSSSLPCGIIYMHAYSVIQVKSNIAGEGINLCQCRNPHGAGGKEPDLAWKDHAPEWTQHPKVEKECGIHKTGHKADGLFWIQDRDFFGPNSDHFNTVYLVKNRMKPRSSEHALPQ